MKTRILEQLETLYDEILESAETRNGKVTLESNTLYRFAEMVRHTHFDIHKNLGEIYENYKTNG